MFRTIFSSKYTTAVISDSSNKIYLVPIKHTIGDYFVTELNKTTHVFKIVGSQIKHFHGWKKNVFSLIFYDTRHYKPLNPKSDELEKVLKENSLPKVNSTLAKVFKALGSQEKKDFEKHTITELIKQLNDLKQNKQKQSAAIKRGYDYDDKSANVINFLKSLGTEEIVTPLKSISEYIQDDLITTEPAFMGSIISNYQRVDVEHKIISNAASLGKISWVRIALFATLIGAAVMIGVLMYDMGMFSSGSNPLDNFFGISSSGGAGLNLSDDAAVQRAYPTPESLKSAIDSGAVDYNKLSPNIRGMIDSLG